jgi:molybdopterin-binding protein
MNVFENYINQIVKVTLNKKADIQFFNGTLFVSGITFEEAGKVYIALNKSYRKAYNASVDMSFTQGSDEYAFDFC